jgi:hypothetical protein
MQSLKFKGGTWQMKRIGVLAGLVLLTVVLSLVSVLGDSRTVTAQFTGSKLCSVIVGGDWRDTFSVPSGWTRNTCRIFRNSVGAYDYQLGCAFSNGFSWGSGGGGTPSQNCGW